MFCESRRFCAKARDLQPGCDEGGLGSERPKAHRPHAGRPRPVRTLGIGPLSNARLAGCPCQIALRALIMPSLRELQLKHALYYLEVLGEAQALYLQGGGSIASAISRFESEWANIQCAHAWAEAHYDTDAAASALCCAYPLKGAYLLDLRRHPRECKRWFELGL